MSQVGRLEPFRRGRRPSQEGWKPHLLPPSFNRRKTRSENSMQSIVSLTSSFSQMDLLPDVW
jgi:hypothetical protein